MRGEKKQEVKQDTNSWMTTYTDLMTLLLTFFVLLLSMSIIDKERKRLAINSLVGAFGFKPGAHSVIGKPRGLNITVGTTPMQKEDVAFEKLRNIALKNGMENEMATIKEKERIVIKMGDRVFFKQGSAQLDSESVPFLKELTQFLKKEECFIELRGYCAPSEIVLEKNPLKRSMVLSTERAFAVFEYFRNQGGIPAKQMAAHGFGKNYKGEAEDKKKAKINRQVEIIMDYGENIPFRVRQPRGKNALLDFKGFFFRIPGETHGEK